MNKTNTRAMVETAFVSAIGVILSAISVYIPAFAFLSFFVTPAAIGIIGTKWGRKYSISAAIVTTFLAVILFGPWNGIPVGLFAAVGVGVGEGNRLSLGTIKRLLLPSIAMFVAVLVTFIAQAYISGIDLSMIDIQMTEQARMIADQALQTNSNITQEQADLFVKNVDKLATGLKDAFFVAVAIAAVSYSYITIQISIWLGKRLHISIALADLMSSYRMSNKLKWILLGVYAFFFGQALAIFGVIDMFLDLRTRYKARQ
ncbi:MAG: DUF2232 domain-containing protein [Veillonella sp.]|nr:DUF2232 domain-containing protein [Veillonella sp.]